MFIKNTFAFFLASAAIAASSVSAGGVRGVVHEKVGVIRGSRYLKENNNNMNNNNMNNDNANSVTVTTVDTVAVVPVAVTPPVSLTPTGVNLWLSICSTQRLATCAGGAQINGCTQCLYAQSFLSSAGDAGINSCSTRFCSGCNDEARTFYNCGAQPVGSAPIVSTTTEVASTTTNVVAAPIADPEPVVVIVPNFADSTTSEGCPILQPVTGSDCSGKIPEPFLYHKCYYTSYICSCRTDSPYYICTERQAVVQAPVVTVPVVTGTPVNTTPANPVATIPGGGEAGCSDAVISGSVCSSVGESCCVGGQSLCVCGSGNQFVCQQSVCGVQVTVPETPAEPVQENPVTDAAPVTPAEPVQETPVTDAAPVTSAEPVQETPVTDAAPETPAEPVQETPVTETVPETTPVTETTTTVATTEGGFTIPDGTDFSRLNEECPSTITNCDSCSLPEGAFETSCSAFSSLDYQGTTYSDARIQCRCYTQDNPNPVWECRYVADAEGTITVNVSPSCVADQGTVSATGDVQPVQETPVTDVAVVTVVAAPETPAVAVEQTPVTETVPETAPITDTTTSVVVTGTAVVTDTTGTVAVTGTTTTVTATGSGVTIPSGTNFSLLNAECPSTITNCDSCSVPNGGFEGSCTANSSLDYQGTTYSDARIQCRCYTQDNPNPVWDCRYIADSENTITVDVSPSCVQTSTVPETGAMEPEPQTPVAEIAVVAPVAEPVVITGFVKPTECIDRLPTSGLNTCALAPGAVCCYAVQIEFAVICTCEDGIFQCRDGSQSECPDDQNANIIVAIPNSGR